MSLKPNLRSIDNSTTKSPDLDIDPDDILAALEYYQTQYGGGDDGPPVEPTFYRHQLMNMDFWFIFAAGACLFSIFTSFLPTDLFEPLAASAFGFIIFAMIANLTREKQGVVVHERHIVIRLPRWLGFGYIPTNKPSVEQ